MRMWLRSGWVLALVVSLAGCDLSTEHGTAGTFSAVVTGDISAQLSGTALFGSFHDGQFSMAMTDPNGLHAIAVGRFEGRRPAVGTYVIEHFEAETGFVASYARDADPAAVFQAEGGEIEITVSSTSRLSGTLTFDAIGHLTADPGTPLSITVTANFEARCVQTGGTDCL